MLSCLLYSTMMYLHFIKSSLQNYFVTPLTVGTRNKLGSGCGTVGRAVTFNTRNPSFTLTVNYIEKSK